MTPGPQRLIATVTEGAGMGRRLASNEPAGLILRTTLQAVAVRAKSQATPISRRRVAGHGTTGLPLGTRRHLEGNVDVWDAGRLTWSSCSAGKGLGTEPVLGPDHRTLAVVADDIPGCPSDPGVVRYRLGTAPTATADAVSAQAIGFRSATLALNSQTRRRGRGLRAVPDQRPPTSSRRKCP